MHNKKKQKIINDPIYGFIKIEEGIITKLIDHPYFQRLRRISQLGLSYLVYPGAHHTRFHHAIGCLFLMNNAVLHLKSKGHKITKNEAKALNIAILLHDIGHGPFSHALEKSIISNISHENISSLFMQKLNEEFNGKLSLAIKIFNNQYHKRFLHQLVSSQLDVDRLDYLKRDSFYSGVTEGNIGTERIINMLDVINDELVVEEKGIYSVEKFLIARRLMYWQVYLHKTVISAEKILTKILKRARELIMQGKQIYTTNALKIFLENNYSLKLFQQKTYLLNHFAEIDDFDIYICLKNWVRDDDFVLSKLSSMIIDRKLLKIKIQNIKFRKNKIQSIINNVQNQYKITQNEAKYFVFSEKITNSTYNTEKTRINILMKDSTKIDITKASNQFNTHRKNNKNEKYFLCYPEGCL